MAIRMKVIVKNGENTINTKKRSIEVNTNLGEKRNAHKSEKEGKHKSEKQKHS